MTNWVAVTAGNTFTLYATFPGNETVPGCTAASLLFLRVVAGVEAGRLRERLGDAAGRGAVGGEVQGGALWSGSSHDPAGRPACRRLDLGLLHVLPHLQDC